MKSTVCYDIASTCDKVLKHISSTQAFIFQMQPPTNSPAGSPLTEACSKIAYVNSITPKVTQTGHFSFRFHGNLVNLIQQFTSDMMYIYWNSYKPKQLTSETTLKARDHLYSLVQQQNSFYLSIWQQSPDFTANDFDEKKNTHQKVKDTGISNQCFDYCMLFEIETFT